MFAQTVRKWGRVVIKSWFPKIGKGLPEAAPAAVDSAEAGSLGGNLAGAGVLGDVLQVPPLGAES